VLLHTWGIAPSANFYYTPQYPYTGETVTFNASSSYDPDGTIVSYFWDFGDGTNGTGEIINHTYADDGTYTVALTVTDNDGLSDTAFDSVTVLNRPPVASFTESAETVLTSDIIYFNASASYDPDGSIVSYFWDFGDGTNATGITVGHAYADDGNYTVTLTVTDDDGATDTVTATKTILNRPPVASFAESAETVYTGETIAFNASSSYDPDGSIVSYFWDFGDGTNATGTVVSHAYADDGVYTVTLTVTDDDGATASTNATKTVLNRSPHSNLYRISRNSLHQRSHLLQRFRQLRPRRHHC
jgi:PKD repeat protein